MASKAQTKEKASTEMVVQHDPDTGEILPTTAPATPQQVASIMGSDSTTMMQWALDHPRSYTKVMQNILSLVTMSPRAAEECNYALPRGGKAITGPSIRLAEIVQTQYKNSKAGARVVDVNRFEKYVEAEGFFFDMETNTLTVLTVRRSIVDSKGRLFKEDMIIVTGNAAQSIAKRNAILAGVPKVLWVEAYEAALATIKGSIKTLPERRDAMFKAFAAFGVKPEQITSYLEVGGVADIGLDELATLIAIHKQLKDGDQDVTDFFPEEGKTKPPGDKKPNAGGLDDIAAEGKASEASKSEGDDPKDGDEAAQGDGAEGGAGGGEATTEANSESDAFKRGRDARKKGMGFRAVPGDLREDAQGTTDWRGGWQAEDKAINDGQRGDQLKAE